MIAPICKFDTRTGYLDHLARQGCDVRLRAHLLDDRLFIDGATADEAGSLALLELSRERQLPVVVQGKSEHHQGKTYRATNG